MKRIIEKKKVIRNQRFGMAMTPYDWRLLNRLAKKSRLSKTEFIIQLIKKERDYAK
jgi:hypothetical protein